MQSVLQHSSSLRQLVADRAGLLTEADHRLVRILFADPAHSAFLSVSELARLAGVHQASAVRFAQKLGFAGYPELRARLQAEFLALVQPAGRMRSSLEKVRTGSLLENLVLSERRNLGALLDHVSDAELQAAAALLRQAGRIFVFAQGHACALADLAIRRLMRTGYATTDLRLRGRDLAERAAGLTARDIVLAFALRRLPQGLPPLLGHAREVGARMIAVSDQLGLMLEPRPDIVLAAPRGDEHDYQSLLVPMTVLNALLLTLAASDHDRSVEALQRLAALARRFEPDTVWPGDRKRRRG